MVEEEKRGGGEKGGRRRKGEGRGEKGMEGKKRVVERERRKRVKKGGQGEEARW